MARIETAYSLELKRIMDPMEANEFWMDGLLKDKKAFKCIDENCSAGITCKNMDTFAENRKVNPHFIMSSIENMHSPHCEVQRELEEKERQKKSSKGVASRQSLGKTVYFHAQRPSRHGVIEHQSIDTTGYCEKSAANGREKASKAGNSYKSNYYWLYSLIRYYIDSYKRGNTEEDKVEVNFGHNRKYTYTLDKLFKRIKTEPETTEKDRNHYVYYGKGRIFHREDGGYDLVFNETFNTSEKRVKCIVSKETIDSCRYGRINKLKPLQSAIGKEKFIYIFSSKKVNEKYKTVFLNIDNLDLISISEFDLDNIESDNEKRKNK